MNTSYTKIIISDVIKEECPHCKAINDILVELFSDEDGYKCLMTNGIAICWYCKGSIGWKLSEKTIREIFKKYE